MRLITLGDSITAGDRYWAGKLSNELNCELINLALPAAQNPLQIQIMNEWLLDNDLQSDDIVIWQLGLSWHPLVCIGTEHWDKVERADRLTRPIFDVPSYLITNNKVDNKDKINLLHINPILGKFINRKHTNNDADVLQNLLYMFNIIKKICPRILIVKGKNDWISNLEYWKNTKEILGEKKIDFLDEGIVDWCIRNKLEIMSDNIHPTEESSHTYAIKELLPKLKSLGWV
jgi:hypothetical protein